MTRCPGVFKLWLVQTQPPAMHYYSSGFLTQYWFTQRFPPESFSSSALVSLNSVFTCLSLQSWGQQQFSQYPFMHPRRAVDISVCSALYFQDGVVTSKLFTCWTWNLKPEDFSPSGFHSLSLLEFFFPLKISQYQLVRDKMRHVGTRKLQVKHLVVILEIKGALVKLRSAWNLQ